MRLLGTNFEDPMRLRLFLAIAGVLGLRGRIHTFGDGPFTSCSALTSGGVRLARWFGLWPQRIEWSF